MFRVFGCKVYGFRVSGFKVSGPRGLVFLVKLGVSGLGLS